VTLSPDDASDPVILVGADSRAAAAIARRLDGRRLIGIARRDGPGERLLVRDYAEVPQGLPLQGAVIVICAGSDQGTPAQLHHLNVAVPLAWAAAGAAGGARQLVQISSFSVFGRTDTIDAGTPPRPQTDYGRSKLAAEEELARVRGPMAISVLRVPILVAPATAHGPPDKLARLAGLMARLHVAPAPSAPVRRSMISYDGLAAAVESLIAHPRAQAMAADPEPFTYDAAARIARDCGRTLHRVPVPRLATALMQSLAPGLADRLFASSVLADRANLLAGRDDFERLSEVVRSHFA
jgi:nucleoside-diphosphate-sugar epimerase